MKKNKRYIEISKGLLGKIPIKPEKHFSFILKGKKIISIGWNSPIPCKKGKEHFFKWNDTHSELDAIVKVGKKDLNRYTLLNVRINKQGKIRNSKPCAMCQNLIKMYNLKKVYYTTTDSEVFTKF